MLTAAFQKLGLPIVDINNEEFENEGIWRSIPVALDNGSRRGTYREVFRRVLTASCFSHNIE